MEQQRSTAGMNRRGVIYLALGSRRYLALCACSVQSLRWAGYEGPIRVLVDDIAVAEPAFHDLNVELVFVEKLPESEMASRSVKTRVYDFAPWPQALYLDCDIIVLQNPESLWDELGESPLGIIDDNPLVSECTHGTRREIELTLAQGVNGRQLNSGVIAWRQCEETRAFFEQWHREWCRFSDIDQLALLRALSLSKLDAKILPRVYNCSSYDSVMEALSAKTIFWHALGGRDVKLFSAVFGPLFKEKCRILCVSFRELIETYYAFAPYRGLKSVLPIRKPLTRRVRSGVGHIVRNWIP